MRKKLGQLADDIDLSSKIAIFIMMVHSFEAIRTFFPQIIFLICSREPMLFSMAYPNLKSDWWDRLMSLTFWLKNRKKNLAKKWNFSLVEFFDENF